MSIATGLPVWQSQSEKGWHLLGVFLFFFFSGLPVWQTQSESAFISSFFLKIFSVSVKVLPVTPLLSGVLIKANVEEKTSLLALKRRQNLFIYSEAIATSSYQDTYNRG